MKRFLWISFSIILFFACHRTTYPTRTPAARQPATASARAPLAPAPAPPSAIPAEPGNLKAPAVTATATAKIVIDGYGKILTPQNKLPPDENIKPDYTKMARAFTPNELTNLRFRYHAVPPRVLYVPRQYTLQSQRGTYCVYMKKFWYWQKEDGFFYLDETYYK